MKKGQFLSGNARVPPVLTIAMEDILTCAADVAVHGNTNGQE